MREISKQFPGPKPVPFIGNLLEYEKDPYKIFTTIMKFNKKYGKAVAIHGMGLEWDVFITDPKDIEVILTKGKTAQKSSIYKFFTQWLG